MNLYPVSMAFFQARPPEMAHNTIQRDAVEGRHEHIHHHPKLAAGREGIEASASHHVSGATQLLSSLSLPNKISTMVITVPDGVSVTEVSLSGEGSDVIASWSQVMNSSLSSLKSMSNRTMMESSSSWSAEEVGAVSIVSLMVPFILLSNVVVIFCVIRFRGLHTPTNYFITSLAAVDIVVALATPFVIVIEVFHFGDATGSRHVMMCLFPNRTLMMACGVSVLTLAAIAYDRHTALVSPLEYVTIMTSRKVVVMVIASWIYSLVIVWLPLAVGWYDVPSHGTPCSGNLIHGKAPVLFLGAIFAPSCLVILICYFRIFIVARQHVKAIAAVELSVHRRLQAKVIVKDTKYATTLALIIGAFLALWLPYLLYIFTKTIISMKFDVWIQTYLIFLAVLNSGINPWIYAFKNNELRAALRRLHWELCGARYCRPTVVRKSCQVSVISSTPRLSLTDSAVVSYFSDTSLYCEKRPRNLDHLSYDATFPFVNSRTRSPTQVGGLSSRTSSICLASPVRHTASCSNLSAFREINSLVLQTNILKSSSSIKDPVVQSAIGQCALNDADSYNQVSNRKLIYRKQLSLETLSKTSKSVLKDGTIRSSTSSLKVKASSPIYNDSLIVPCHSWIPCVSSFRRPAQRVHHLKTTSSTRQHYPEALAQATMSPTLTPHPSPTLALQRSPTHIHTPLTLTSSTESLNTSLSDTPPTLISHKTLFSHTEKSSTLPPHTRSAPAPPPHTRTLPHLPTQTKPSLHTSAKLKSTTSLPLTVVSVKPHIQQSHILVSPTAQLQSCTVLPPSQQLQTTVSPTAQLQSSTVLPPSQQLQITVSPTHEPHTALSPPRQTNTIQSSIFHPHQTVFNYIEFPHHNLPTHYNRTLQ